MLTKSQKRHFDRWNPVGKKNVQDYYVRRVCVPSLQFPWADVIDPDGQRRNRLDESERKQWKQDNRELLAWLREQPAGVLCDIGCGPGWLIQEMQWLGWECIGVETAPDAKQHLVRHDIGHVFSLDDLPDDEFDLVVAYHVIEHMEDPIHELGEMRRILKRDGWLVIGTPDFGSPCAERFDNNYRMLHDPTHISLFTNESMHRFLREFGFEISRVEYPFPQRYATAETFLRWNDTSQVSPPWPGNWMTFYCRK